MQDKCRAPAGQVGNVIPLTEGGGQWHWENLQSLCQPHHDEMTVEDALEDPSAIPSSIAGSAVCGPCPC